MVFNFVGDRNFGLVIGANRAGLLYYRSKFRVDMFIFTFFNANQEECPAFGTRQKLAMNFFFFLFNKNKTYFS